MTTPTIPNGASYMAATIYTGDGSQTISFSNAVNGTAFQPDMVWSKIRTGTTQAIGVFDSVRGTTGQALDTAATTAEGTWNGAASSDYGYVSAFNSNGFSVNDGAVATTGGYVNYATRTYVAWQWKAGGTAVSNTSGSITSSVSANTTSGFSVVTYTGNGTAGATVGHGLGVAPQVIIVKNRGTVTNWQFGSSYNNATSPWNYYMRLNTTAAAAAASTIWNNTAPSSSVFTVGTDNEVNFSANTYVAYCWTPIAGYSAFGSYAGNSSTDGPFIYTGFRPRFVMLKASSGTTGNWIMLDTSRDTYNMAVNVLEADVSDAEAALSPMIDIVSNGFKIRRNSAGVNSSGCTYIYVCFAENPFKYANAR